MRATLKYALAITSVSVLAACGGGGGGGNASSEVLYPLSTALAEYVSNAATYNITVSGTLTNAGISYNLSGSGKIVENTTAGTFNGVSGLKKTQTTTGQMTVNGVSQALNDVTYYYYNTNYQPLGYTNTTAYCISSNVKSIPQYIAPGQSGEWYTTDCYTNSSKAVKVGTSAVTYQLSAVTDKTADLVINQTITDASGKISAPARSTYRITTLGDVTFREQSASIEYGGASLSLTLKAN